MPGNGPYLTFLTFEDIPTLLSVMTPRRLELLGTLRQNGPLSIRALAKALGRNYKNVHTDVSSLESVGLVERTTDGTLNAPWDEIDAEGLDSRKLLAVCQGVV